MIQTSLLSSLTPEEPLEPHVVLYGDSRWSECLREFTMAPYFGLDTEFFGPWDTAKGIDPFNSRTFVRLVQVGLPSGLAVVADLGGAAEDRDRALDRHGEFMAILAARGYSREARVVGMNLSTEYVVLRRHYGISLRMMRDVMLMSQVLWAGVGSRPGRRTENGFENQPVMKHSLHAICDRLGVVVDKTEQASDWAMRLSNKQLNYAGNDAIAPIKCAFKLGEMLHYAGLTKTIEAEWAAQPGFGECEVNGLPVDEVQLRADVEAWDRVREATVTPFRKRFPEVAPSEAIQVGTALESALDVHFCSVCQKQADPLAYSRDRDFAEEHPLVCCERPMNKSRQRVFVERKTNKVGRDYTASDTADDVLVLYRDVPYVRSLLEWRSLTTCRAWLVGVLNNVEEGAIRAHFQQIAGGISERGGDRSGRGMGRSACSDPVNLQNPASAASSRGEKLGAPPIRGCIRTASSDLPAKLRALSLQVGRGGAPSVKTKRELDAMHLLFEAEFLEESSSGRREVLIVADLSQSHARIAAQASQDRVLLRDFRAGNDFHLALAHRLLNQAGHHVSFEEAKEIYEDPAHTLHRLLKALRKTAKPTNYSQLNMASAATMKRTAETAAEPVFFTDEEAETAKSLWRNELYHDLYEFQRRSIRQANRHNHTFEPLGFPGTYGEIRGLTGRRLFLQKEYSDRWNSWGVKGTDAVSGIWMTTEADVIKHAMGELLDDFDCHPEWNGRIRNMAHDELDLTAWEEYGVVVAGVTNQRFAEAMRWGGVVDLPVEEAHVDVAKMVKDSWAAK